MSFLITDEKIVSIKNTKNGWIWKEWLRRSQVHSSDMPFHIKYISTSILMTFWTLKTTNLSVVPIVTIHMSDNTWFICTYRGTTFFTKFLNLIFIFNMNFGMCSYLIFILHKNKRLKMFVFAIFLCCLMMTGEYAGRNILLKRT